MTPRNETLKRRSKLVCARLGVFILLHVLRPSATDWLAQDENEARVRQSLGDTRDQRFAAHAISWCKITRNRAFVALEQIKIPLPVKSWSEVFKVPHAPRLDRHLRSDAPPQRLRKKASCPPQKAFSEMPPISLHPHTGHVALEPIEEVHLLDRRSPNPIETRQALVEPACAGPLSADNDEIRSAGSARHYDRPRAAATIRTVNRSGKRPTDPTLTVKLLDTMMTNTRRPKRLGRLRETKAPNPTTAACPKP